MTSGLINFGNIKMLFMILKPKFMELEVGVVIDSRPSDHNFRSVCWFVCLSVCLYVCLFVQSFSQTSLIRFRSN